MLALRPASAAAAAAARTSPCPACLRASNPRSLWSTLPSCSPPSPLLLPQRRHKSSTTASRTKRAPWEAGKAARIAAGEAARAAALNTTRARTSEVLGSASEGWEGTEEQAGELAKKLGRRLRNHEIPLNFPLRHVVHGRLPPTSSTITSLLTSTPDFDPSTHFFELHSTRTDLKIVKLVAYADVDEASARALAAEQAKVASAKLKPTTLRAHTADGFGNDGKPFLSAFHATSAPNDTLVSLAQLKKKLERGNRVACQLAVKTSGPREKRVGWTRDKVDEFKRMADGVFESLVKEGEGGVLSWVEKRGAKDGDEPMAVVTYTPSKAVREAFIKSQYDAAREAAERKKR